MKTKSSNCDDMGLRWGLHCIYMAGDLDYIIRQTVKWWKKCSPKANLTEPKPPLKYLVFSIGGSAYLYDS